MSRSRISVSRSRIALNLKYQQVSSRMTAMTNTTIANKNNVFSMRPLPGITANHRSQIIRGQLLEQPLLKFQKA